MKSLVVPLATVGLIRWTCWLIRRVPGLFYRPRRTEHSATLGVVVPVYQEDPEILDVAIRSWLANDVDEVVLVIDETDEACAAVARRHPVRVIVTSVPGKRDALRRGWESCASELVALVDSDTVWAPDVGAEVRKPFADPGVGGVGTRQNVYRPRGFLHRVTDMFLDYRYFDENAAQTVCGEAVSCLSGRTAVYRRHLLLEVSAEFMNETFLGVPCVSGDDKRLTMLILERGHRTRLQRSARVWSTFPSDWRVFFRQRTRWARNTWRSDLRALSRPWLWRHPFLAFTMTDKAAGAFTLLMSPACMTWAIAEREWRFAAALGSWWWLSRAVKMIPHLRERPSSWFLIPGFVLVSFLTAVVRIYALLTIRRQRWLTRGVAVVGGETTRLQPAA
ncbi:glycosyltransferase [Bailinhaonella thermotolerans]|uniref:Glycosyltransferase n=1 Tax=Bailinhaonella thermotolerans TaxID=1070861 RepID=A0A3A4B6J6_9ACTN|nr:glycosyltransferase [Bailinhaonella thermotolerans]RJL33144.1 glycosyltransferase [Bailinhaonella thermotolerans]